MATPTPRKSIGTKRTASGGKNTRSRGSLRNGSRRFVVCIANDGYRASLEVRKIYTALTDSSAEKLGLMRVIDESGEEYLYPEKQFSYIALPPGLAKALAP